MPSVSYSQRYDRTSEIHRVHAAWKATDGFSDFRRLARTKPGVRVDRSSEDRSTPKIDRQSRSFRGEVPTRRTSVPPASPTSPGRVVDASRTARLYLTRLSVFFIIMKSVRKYAATSWTTMKQLTSVTEARRVAACDTTVRPTAR